MIGYTTFGTNDLERAAKFYDGLFAELGGKRAMATDSLVLWATGPGTPMVGVIKPNDGKTATHGNGTMIALAAKDKAQVDRVHALAMSMGAKDEGAPGPRGDGGFYAGYFRDLDGNKLDVYHYG